MNKGANKNAANNAMLNLITVVVILAFLAAGVYAAYGKISEDLDEKAITSGEKEATVSYLAKQANMSVEDYLAQYGLSLGGDVKKKTTQTEMTENMTIENYLKYSGDEKTADDVIAEAGLTGVVTKDTLWKDFEAQAPVSYFVNDEETFNQIKEYYGFGDEVTMDMPYADFKKLIDDAQEAKENEAAEADNSAAEESTEAEGETAETEAETTPAE